MRSPEFRFASDRDRAADPISTTPSGILLLQPIPSNAQQKRKGLQLHQAFQYASLVVIVGGAAVIIYNKAIHGGELALRVAAAALYRRAPFSAAKHFTTWHAKSGLVAGHPF